VIAKLMVTCAVLALTGALTSSAFAQQPAKKVGIIAELSGGGAPSGTMYRDGVLLGIKAINASGGILGSKIESDVADTQSDAATSVAVMRRMVNDKPFAVFGTVYSASTLANMKIAQQAGVPQFVGSEATQIVDQGNPNVFLMSFSQRMAFAKMVKWIVQDLKADKIAMVYANDAFGKGGHDAIVTYLKQYNKELVVDIPTESQQADFTAELTKVRNSGATHVVVYNHEEENARIMIQIRKLGLNIQAVGDNLCAATTIAAGGAAVDGAKCTVPMTALSPVPAMKQVAVDFQKEYGSTPDHNGFKGYIGAFLLKAAVERVGSWDQEKVRACLHKNLFSAEESPGLLLDTFILENGDADRASFVVEVKNGQNVVSEVLGLVGGPYAKHGC
jgi:branched-chain amino acid transport system substrate-binding protein